jgi:hypothetical protein
VRLGEDKAHASGELSDSKLLTEQIPICDLHMREREDLQDIDTKYYSVPERVSLGKRVCETNTVF